MIAEPLLRTAGSRARLLLVALSIVVSFLGFRSAAQSAGSNVVEFVEISGVLDPPVASYLERKIDEASRNRSTGIIVRLDVTDSLGVSVPGLVRAIQDSKVPVVVWAGPRGATARGAGFFLLIASDIAAMAPGTSVGPGLAGNPASSGERRAARDALARLASSAAELAERSPDAAARAVVRPRETGGEEALDSGLVDLVATLPGLLDELEGREIARMGGMQFSTEGAALRFHSMAVWERILHASVDPEVAYFLLLFGFFGLTFELYHPGIGAAGLLGGGAVALGIWALTILPTAWIGVVILVAGVGLNWRDLHRGDFGLFTAAATAALVAGSLLLFWGAPAGFGLPVWAIPAAIAFSLVFYVSVMSAAIRARLSRPAPPH